MHFWKHITPKIDKYLIFYLDFECLHEMRDMAAVCLVNINPEVRSYIAYSNAPESNRHSGASRRMIQMH